MGLGDSGVETWVEVVAKTQSETQHEDRAGSGLVPDSGRWALAMVGPIPADHRRGLLR